MNICFENYDRFSGFIKFWSSERNTKIRCNIYILMKKMKILRKAQAKMKTRNGKKICGNESHEKETLEAVIRRYSSKKVFLKDLKARNIIKNRLQDSCFLVKFTKFLRTSFFTEHFRWLLLKLKICKLWVYYILQ